MSNDEQKIENNSEEEVLLNNEVDTSESNSESNAENLSDTDEINETAEEICEDGKENEESVNEVKAVEPSQKKKGGFLRWLGITIVDQAVVVGVSYIIVFLIGVILPSFGYRIANRVMMVLVVYIVTNILYGAILNDKTVGKRIFL